MSVVSADEEEDDRHAKQELFRRGILISVVDLLPHVEIVISAGIELEGNSAHPVEHDECDKHIGDVGERPRCLLRHPGDDIIEDLQRSNQDKMDRPSAYFNSSLLVFSKFK